MQASGQGESAIGVTYVFENTPEKLIFKFIFPEKLLQLWFEEGCRGNIAII